MRNNWKEFKDFVKEDFKKSIRPSREFLWSARKFIIGFTLISLFDCVYAYKINEMSIYDFLMNMGLGLILMLFPFAYGIKKDDKGGDHK